MHCRRCTRRRCAGFGRVYRDWDCRGTGLREARKVHTKIGGAVACGLTHGAPSLLSLYSGNSRSGRTTCLHSDGDELFHRLVIGANVFGFPLSAPPPPPCSWSRRRMARVRRPLSRPRWQPSEQAGECPVRIAPSGRRSGYSTLEFAAVVATKAMVADSAAVVITVRLGTVGTKRSAGAANSM
jgi:hypothetical protein